MEVKVLTDGLQREPKLLGKTAWISAYTGGPSPTDGVGEGGVVAWGGDSSEAGFDEISI